MPHDRGVMLRGHLEAELVRVGRDNRRGYVFGREVEPVLEEFGEIHRVAGAAGRVDPVLLDGSHVLGGGDDLGHPTLASLLEEVAVTDHREDADDHDRYEEFAEGEPSIVVQA